MADQSPHGYGTGQPAADKPKDIPIIFSGPMVRALLEGRKTMTRRLAWRTKWNEGGPIFDAAGGQMDVVEPHEVRIGPSPWQKAKPGDRLWVRETITRSGGLVQYAADHKTSSLQWPWPEEKQDPRPSIHMPRWASRLTLTVTETKIERLQKISEDDARAEGAVRLVTDGDGKFFESDKGDCRTGFAGLWAHLHGAESWDANPEVVALTFTVAKHNIDRKEST